MEYIKYSGYLAKALLVVVVLFGLIHYKKLNKATLLICSYVLGALIVEIVSHVLVFYGYQNLLLIYVLLLLQLLVFGGYFKTIIPSVKVKKSIQYTIALVLLLVLVLAMVNPSYFLKLNPEIILLANVPLIAYSSYCLAQGLTQKNVLVYSYINFGLFLYLASSTIVFSSGELLLDLGLSVQYFDYLYIFNNTIYIIFIVLILMNLWSFVQKKSLS